MPAVASALGKPMRPGQAGRDQASKERGNATSATQQRTIYYGEGLHCPMPDRVEHAPRVPRRVAKSGDCLPPHCGTQLLQRRSPAERRRTRGVTK